MIECEAAMSHATYPRSNVNAYQGLEDSETSRFKSNLPSKGVASALGCFGLEWHTDV